VDALAEFKPVSKERMAELERVKAAKLLAAHQQGQDTVAGTNKRKAAAPIDTSADTTSASAAPISAKKLKSAADAAKEGLYWEDVNESPAGQLMARTETESESGEEETEEEEE
jgi:hypothetical protein